MDIKNIIVSSIVMLILDAIYLTSISSGFKKMIYNIQGKEMGFRLGPVIACYIALIFGLNYFILDGNIKDKVFNAFLLGLVIYTVYETTNYALIDKWELNTVIIDSMWGGILFALTAFITLSINKN
jgi:uncharacterized membrane protein